MLITANNISVNYQIDGPEDHAHGTAAQLTQHTVVREDQMARPLPKYRRCDRKVSRS